MICKQEFSQLVHQYEKSMYAFALSILKKHEDACDCVQEAVIKAYCKISDLRNAEKFKPWVMTVIHRTAMDMLRSGKSTVNLDSCEELSSPDSAADIPTKLSLRRAVEELKLPYRTVTVLFYYEGLSVKQISSVTGDTQDAVRAQLSRARRMLAEKLDMEDFYNE